MNDQLQQKTKMAEMDVVEIPHKQLGAEDNDYVMINAPWHAWPWIDCKRYDGWTWNKHSIQMKSTQELTLERFSILVYMIFHNLNLHCMNNLQYTSFLEFTKAWELKLKYLICLLNVAILKILLLEVIKLLYKNTLKMYVWF